MSEILDVSFQKVQDDDQNNPETPLQDHRISLSDPLLMKNPSSINASDLSYKKKPNESEAKFSDSYSKKPRRTKRIIVVNGQSCLDLDEIFGFDEQNMHRSISKRFSMAKRITNIFSQNYLYELDESSFIDVPTYLLYFLLIITTLIGSIISPLVTGVRYNVYLRLGWRFLMQAIMFIPFAIYESRNVDEKFKKCYSIKYTFQKENFKKLFYSGLNYGFNIFFMVQACDYTNWANAILLGSLQNFGLSIIRAINQEPCNFVEKVGRGMCILGYKIQLYLSRIFMLCVDVYKIEYDPNAIYFWGDSYFNKKNFDRVYLGLLMPLASSFIVAYVSNLTQDIKYIYPPFYSMIFLSLGMSLSFYAFGFFIMGATLDYDPIYGFLGILKHVKVTDFLFYTLVMNAIFFLGQTYIGRVYEATVPATQALLDPILYSFFLHLLEIQTLPGIFTILAYFTIQPGQFVIIMGQDILEKEIQYHEKSRSKLPPQSSKQSPMLIPQNRTLESLSQPRIISGILKNFGMVKSESNLSYSSKVQRSQKQTMFALDEDQEKQKSSILSKK